MKWRAPLAIAVLALVAAGLLWHGSSDKGSAAVPVGHAAAPVAPAAAVGPADTPLTELRRAIRASELARPRNVAAPNPDHRGDDRLDAMHAALDRSEVDALRAVALDDDELQVLLAAVRRERAQLDKVAADAVVSSRGGSGTDDVLDLSGVDRSLESLLGDRYPTYLQIKARGTLEGLDEVVARCRDAGC